jgi:protein-L-isoaspartate O-methyltransferase
MIYTPQLAQRAFNKLLNLLHGRNIHVLKMAGRRGAQFRRSFEVIVVDIAQSEAGA